MFFTVFAAGASKPKLQYKSVTVYHGLPSTDQRGYISPNQTLSNLPGQSSCKSTTAGHDCITENLLLEPSQPSNLAYQVDRTNKIHCIHAPTRVANYPGHHQLPYAQKTSRVNIDGTIQGSARQMPTDIKSPTHQLHHQSAILPPILRVNLKVTNHESTLKRPLHMRLPTHQLPQKSNRPQSEAPFTVRQPYTPTIDLRNSDGATNLAISLLHSTEKQSQLIDTPPYLRNHSITDHCSKLNLHCSNLTDSAVRPIVQSDTFPSLRTTGNGSSRNISQLLDNLGKTPSRVQPEQSSTSHNVLFSHLPGSSQLNTETLNKITSTNRYPARTAYVRSNSDSDVCFGNYDSQPYSWYTEFNDLKYSSQKKINAGHLSKDLPARQTTGRSSHLVYNQQLPSSYTHHKSSRNSSDTELNRQIQSYHRKLHNSSVKKMAVADDTYDYPENMKKFHTDIHSYDECASSTPPSRISLRNENRHDLPVFRRDIKSSIVVNDDVPCLLKGFEEHDPSVLTTCDVRRIREVEKIVKGWQVERIFQSNEINPSPFINIQTTNERTVDRTESRHKELRTLDTFTDAIFTLPLESHKRNSPIPKSSGVSIIQGAFGFSRPHASFSSLSSQNPSLNSSSLPSSKSSETRPPSLRSCNRLSIGTSEPAVSLAYRSRHSESDSLPASCQVGTPPQSTHPGSMRRSNSMEGITIESLMEQLKALS